MTRQLLYVAHPVSPTDAELLDRMPHEATLVGLERWSANYPGDVRRHTESQAKSNIARAMRWLDWLRRSFVETTFIAPWITSILAGADDSDPVQREAGMLDCLATVERCDGIVLVGDRISSGMRRETEHGTHRLLSGCSWFSLAPTLGDVPEFQVYDLTKLGAEPPARVTSGVLFRSWIWFAVGGPESGAT